MASYQETQVTRHPDGRVEIAHVQYYAWALKNRHLFPVNVNRADRDMLLRVPGLGTKSIDRMIQTRRHHSLRLDDVARIAGSIDKVRPFIEAVDWTPGVLTDHARLRAKLTPQPEQLSLF